MPIIRTYGCEACNHMLTVELRADQWDTPPPDCPMCAAHPMGQEFKLSIGGSARSRATDLAQKIATEDYGVADIQIDGKGQGEVPKVRYQDQPTNLPSAAWEANREMLEGAIAIGRESRLRYGSGLDVLQAGLASGAQPDLIAASKRRSIRGF